MTVIILLPVLALLEYKLICWLLEQGDLLREQDTNESYHPAYSTNQEYTYEPYTAQDM